MGNEVANPFGSSVAIKNRQEMAQRAAASASNGARGGAPDGSVYMNFSGKRGVYTVGSGDNKRTVQEDELWLINVSSFEDGYICWKGGSPASTRMANIYSGTPVAAPAPDELGPFNSQKGEGWYSAKGWVFKSLDEDTQAYLRLNSVSGVAEMSSVIEECASRMGNDMACWPIVQCTAEDFEAQGFKNSKPIFKIYGWLDDDALAKLADPDADIDELIKQSSLAGRLEETKRVRKEQAEEAEEAEDADEPDEPAEEKPRRRRRRAS